MTITVRGRGAQGSHPNTGPGECHHVRLWLCAEARSGLTELEWQARPDLARVHVATDTAVEAP